MTTTLTRRFLAALFVATIAATGYAAIPGTATDAQARPIIVTRTELPGIDTTPSIVP